MKSIVGKRKIFFAIFLVFILCTAVLWFTIGLNLDIEFEGGTMIQIQTENKDFTSAEAEALVRETTGKEVKVQVLTSYNSENPEDEIHMLQIKVTKSEGVLSSDEQSALIQALIDDERFVIPENAEVQVTSVEPSIGEEVRNRGLIAVAISAVLIILYVAIRFRAVSGFSMGVCGVIALIHDALAVVLVYMIFRLPVNESFIAAILTIIGYSINNSIIIYDRIRENMALRKKSTVAEVVDKSIKQTFSRSVLTSLTTLIAVIVVYIFARIYGITSVQQFSFPLIIGILVGTYSSICLAGPMWLQWKEMKGKKEKA